MFRKISFILCATAILQGIIFFSITLRSNTFTKMKEDAYDVLEERVNYRRTSLEDILTENVYNDGMYDDLLAAAQKVHIEKAEDPLIGAGNELLEGLLTIAKSTKSSGVFIIFDQQDIGTSYYPTLYLRDSEPASIAINHADISAHYGAGTLVKSLGLSLDVTWSPQIELNKENENNAFYFKVLEAARKHSDYKLNDLGYWSAPFRLREDDDLIITYTLPLLDENKQVYGVMGIEYKCDYILAQLGYEELNRSQNAAYVYGILNENNEITHSLVSGPAYSYLESSSIQLTNETASIYSIDQAKTETLGSYSKLSMYNANTPFANEQWVLMGIVDKNQLLSNVLSLHQTLFTSVLISMIAALIAALLSSYRFSSPIIQLAQHLKTISHNGEIQLPRVKIAEIDDLSASIEDLSRDVAYASSRLSQILQAVNIPLGAIEFSPSKPFVYCTEMVSKLLEFSEEASKKQELPMELFLHEIDQFRSKIDCVRKNTSLENQNNKHVVSILIDHNVERWIQFKVIAYGEDTLVVVSDVTAEILEKQKLEYERDYDYLTNLLNRRAFRTEVEKHIQEHPEHTGVMVMWDLDNLKYINDTYGHDIGDKYICAAAEVFSQLDPQRAIVARMAGDEFLAYVFDYEDQAKERIMIYQQHKTLLAYTLKLPNNTEQPIRASAGISWYPQDGVTFDELLKHADFAMYNAKSTVKGGIKEFSQQTFDRDELLFSGREELNTLIEKNMVRFAYQPIVEVVTGEIWGYEALMRPISETIKSPLDLYRLAKAQSKLLQMEQLTCLNVIKEYHERQKEFKGCKIFINSMPNISLLKTDIEYIENTYPESVLSNVVIEIIESENLDMSCMGAKQTFARDHHAQIAIDDFGSGYNNEGMLLKLTPDYIKIDMEIVQGVSKDKDREQLVSNIVQLAHSKHAKVIAEGVEDMPDLTICVKLGVDYIQGYYLGKPEYEIKEIKPEKQKLLRSLAHVYAR